jgi:hypothetical protein
MKHGIEGRKEWHRYHTIFIASSFMDSNRVDKVKETRVKIYQKIKDFYIPVSMNCIRSVAHNHNHELLSLFMQLNDDC